MSSYKNNDSTEQIAHELAHTFRLGTFKTKINESETNLKWSTYLILDLLAETPKLSADKISEIYHIELEKVKKQLKDMVTEGVLRVETNIEDKKSKKYSLTESGRYFLKKAHQARHKIYESLLDDWSEAERLQFSSLIQKFNGELNKTDFMSPVN